MSNARRHFDEALANPDPVERAQEICDLAFDAEQLAVAGKREEAIEIFKLLATLDRYDDLLAPAFESADEHLVTLGARKEPDVGDIAEKLHERFKNLSEFDRLLAVAKTLVRENSKRPVAWIIAWDLLEKAERIRPITNNKDRGFKVEVLKHLEKR